MANLYIKIKLWFLHLIDLCLTAITNDSVSYIVKYLHSLEKLSLTGRIEFTKYYELEAMPKLQVLNCPYLSNEERDCLITQLPHLAINQTKGEDNSFYFKIATSHQLFEPEDGFWEMEVAQLFTIRDGGTGGARVGRAPPTFWSNS